MTEIFTAKTVEEAMAQAAKKFGRKQDEIRFEVIEEGKSGFLGFGSKDARVRATVSSAAAPSAPVTAAPAPAPKSESIIDKAEEKAEALRDAIIEKGEAIIDKAEEKVEALQESVSAKAEAVIDKAEVKAEAVKSAVADKAETVIEKADAKAEAVKAKIAEELSDTSAPETPEDDEAEYSLDNFTLIEDEALLNPKVKIAKDYITSVLNAMDVDVTYTVYQNETGAVINIDSDNNGTIIGRRGETLDALQYLCSIIANKGDKDYFRITIDCLGYRSKRKETLEQLAAKVAKSVLRTGRPQPLEPMNPYERRVIHSAISVIEGVSSRSVGEEPYRKIIISSNNPRPNNRRRGGGRNDRNDRGGNRRNDHNNRRRNNNRENFERREIDLSTSFEKDYKKPKPEDSMGGGLYGKIEL
ncbi:MAG: Jag N-terminal domain-containing protein [Ruminococcus sp.]|nr:Jag N-terminal domain-containing protein [Ruminococcus sp.]